MNIQLNKTTNQYELHAGGGVFLTISAHECTTKKIAKNYFERQLSNFLASWQPAKKDS